MPFLLFFVGLVGQLVRLGVITGKEQIADTSLLQAWYLVTTPRTLIEQHFVWLKRYFGLKYFQGFTSKTGTTHDSASSFVHVS